MTLEEHLSTLKYNSDETSHITVNKSKCLECRTKACVYVCPVACYEHQGNSILFQWSACVECGACEIACQSLGVGAIIWNNPRGGFGVVFREG
jgi:ferredoxin-like protein FixX